MLKGLRLRLAVLFTLFTGAVLATALGISLYTAVAQVKSDGEQRFQGVIDTVSVQMQNLGSLPAGQLPAVSDEYPYVISLRLDEGALETSPTWLDADRRDRLFEGARSEALALGYAGDGLVESHYTGEFSTTTPALGEDVVGEGGEAITLHEGSTASVSIMSQTVAGGEGVFETALDGKSYRATYFQWPVLGADGATSLYEVAILEDLAAQGQSIRATAAGYAILLGLGLVVLFLANWLLAKLVLRPTEEGIRRQNEFVAAASHELRSPLAAIRSSLSAADAAPDADSARAFRETAAQEAGRMGRLIDDLLLLAGGDAGSWAATRRPFDLDTLLIETAEAYAPLARERGVALRLDLPGQTLPPVSSDPDRLRQVLVVLLDNALEYAPAGSEVVLAAREKKGGAQLRVADRGPGIPDGEKARVFGRFYRADKSRRDKRHFGLGLSIAGELSALLGLRLALTDTPGGGATFTLTVPKGPSLPA